MAQQTMNPNTVLKDAREAKGMTLDIVHEATKIPLDALKALEQGYSVKILTPFYLRGFIKIYAEFLGLDPQEVLKAYQLDQKTTVKPAVAAPAPVKKEIKETKQSVGTPKHKPARISQPQKELISPQYLKLAGTVLLGLVLVVIAVKSIGAIGSFVKTKFKGHAVAAPNKDLLKGPKEVKSVSSSAGAKLFKAESASQKAELALRANKDSFIQVKVDGKVVFAMVMQKGTVESWKADNEIILSGKDLYDLDMEINGKHIGSLGTIERKAHRVVITKEGLTVKK